MKQNLSQDWLPEYVFGIAHSRSVVLKVIFHTRFAEIIIKTVTYMFYVFIFTILYYFYDTILLAI